VEQKMEASLIVSTGSHRGKRMPFLYILQSARSGKFYIGSALDADVRFMDHQRGQSPYTRCRGPWKLVYQEKYSTLGEARRRERQLKSWKSHRSIQELIDNSGG
jgi:putative endonuclease